MAASAPSTPTGTSSSPTGSRTSSKAAANGSPPWAYRIFLRHTTLPTTSSGSLVSCGLRGRSRRERRLRSAVSRRWPTFAVHHGQAVKLTPSTDYYGLGAVLLLALAVCSEFGGAQALIHSSLVFPASPTYYTISIPLSPQVSPQTSSSSSFSSFSYYFVRTCCSC